MFSGAEGQWAGPPPAQLRPGRLWQVQPRTSTEVTKVLLRFWGPGMSPLSLSKVLCFGLASAMPCLLSIKVERVNLIELALGESLHTMEQGAESETQA